MKPLADMTEREKYQLAYEHYVKSRMVNGHRSHVSLHQYKEMMPICQVEELLIVYGYAK